MTPLRTIKRILVATVGGTVLALGMVLAGIVVASIPIGLALLFLAFATARRGLGSAWSRLSGRNALPSKEVV